MYTHSHPVWFSVSLTLVCLHTSRYRGQYPGGGWSHILLHFYPCQSILQQQENQFRTRTARTIVATVDSEQRMLARSVYMYVILSVFMFYYYLSLFVHGKLLIHYQHITLIGLLVLFYNTIGPYLLVFVSVDQIVLDPESVQSILTIVILVILVFNYN